ncbi:MAG: CHAT domain-containing protein, partial [Waterburya sp.]
MPIKILVLASNPAGTEQLQLNPEIRSIKHSYERSQKRAKFTLQFELAVRISELQRIILKEKPRIVHFCGHGTGHKGLVLENDTGQIQLVSTEALTNLLKIFDRRIECVVLNACHSHVQGEQINQYINFLVATQKEIRDDAALLFTNGFYDALFNGETYRDAYELGCNRIHLELYQENSSHRKLVPVYSEAESKYINLEQHQILIFLEKNPPNLIFQHDIAVSNYTYHQNLNTEAEAKNNLPCPYRGLFNFSPNDAEFFFGRDVFIEQLFQATKTNNFIPVLGASGSGKSSVVLAGLVPRLEQDGNWKFAHFRPGDEPFHALAKALVSFYAPALNSTEQLKQSRQLAAYLREGSVLLKDVFAQIESNYPNDRVLLIADQFEEIFTLCAEEKVYQSFLDLLLACFQTTPNTLQAPPVLVTTMRADFLGQALDYRPLADVLNADIKLGAMNRQELSEVIIKPAAILGVEFEPGLAERILDDVEDEPGNLALLEFALTELWQEKSGKQLTHQAYEKIGRVEGALAEYAEEKYLELQPEEQEQARQIFIQLVNPGEDNKNTRRRVNREQIGDRNWELVNRKHGLADSRLVVTSRSNEERETLEVVHEALIRHWARLKGWLNEDQENLNQKRQLEDAAQAWDKSGKKIDYLLTNKRLRAAKEFQQEQQKKYPLSDLAAKFIASSIKQQRKERIKFFAVFLIIPLIGTVIGGAFVVGEIILNADKKLIRDCVEQEYCPGRIQALERLVRSEKSLESYNLKSADLGSANLIDANLRSA